MNSFFVILCVVLVAAAGAAEDSDSAQGNDLTKLPGPRLMEYFDKAIKDFVSSARAKFPEIVGNTATRRQRIKERISKLIAQLNMSLKAVLMRVRQAASDATKRINEMFAKMIEERLDMVKGLEEKSI